MGKRTTRREEFSIRPRRLDSRAWLHLPEGAEIGKAINEAMKAIEAENDDMKEVLPKTYNRLDNREWTPEQIEFLYGRVTF